MLFVSACVKTLMRLWITLVQRAVRGFMTPRVWGKSDSSLRSELLGQFPQILRESMETSCSHYGGIADMIHTTLAMVCLPVHVMFLRLLTLTHCCRRSRGQWSASFRHWEIIRFIVELWPLLWLHSIKVLPCNGLIVFMSSDVKSVTQFVWDLSGMWFSKNVRDTMLFTWSRLVLLESTESEGIKAFKQINCSFDQHSLIEKNEFMSTAERN